MAPAKSSDPPPAGPAPSASPDDTDLIRSLPGPVIRVLVLFARPIRFLRITTEVLLWKPGRRVESWMVVGGWWAICLGAGHGFKYLLPAAVFIPLLPLDILLLPHIGTLPGLRNKPLPPSTPAEPSTHDSLLMTLSDLHSVHAMIPTLSTRRVVETYERYRQLGPMRLSRGLVVVWAAWLILGRIVGYRALLALLGSILLLLPSPPLAQFIDLLSRSLLVRRSLALLFLFTFGSPPEQSIKFTLHFSLKEWLRGKWAVSRRPSLAFAIRPKMAPGPGKEEAIQDEEEEERGDPIYFKFEVHENQRWWMGLDWTSALVPQERPSWCDSHLLPTSPPGAFTLPFSTFIVLPAPTPSDPDAKVRRTATWKWLDDDWSIVRAGAGARAASTNPLSSTPTVGGVSPNPADDSASGGEASGSINGTRVGSPAKARPASGIFGTSPSDDTMTSPSSASASATTAGRTQSIAEQAFTKGLERLKRAAPAVAGVTGVSSPRSSGEYARPGGNGSTGSGGADRRTSQASDDLAAIDERIAAGSATSGRLSSGAATALMGGGEMIVERDEATDVDGWVYGDNKWENMGPKGGLGKFTRRRRWTRRAICVEIIQRIPSLTLPPSSSVPDSTSAGTSASTTSATSAVSSSALANKPHSPTSLTPQRPPLQRQSSSSSPALTPKASSKEPLPAVQTDTSAMALPGESGMSGLAGLSEMSPTRGRVMGRWDEEGVNGSEAGVGNGYGVGHVGMGIGQVTVVPSIGGTGAGSGNVSGSGSARNEHSRDDVLRQRLKKAMGSVGG